MKKWIYGILSMPFLASCSGDDMLVMPPVPQPEMQYISLNEQKVKQGERKDIDLDGNGTVDFFFNTLHVGDPLLKQDKILFCANSGVGANLYANADDRTKVYQRGAVIPVANKEGFVWNEVLLIVLAQKIIGEVDPPQWSGDWQNSDHKYFPIQLKKGNQRYNGWFELSFSVTDQNIILHKVAISKEAGRDVLAGM